MATPASWQVNGQYYETCSCDFVCPCLPAQMAARPSKGSCTFAMAFQIERGQYQYGAVSLDGLGFIVLGLTPEAMGKGNWLLMCLLFVVGVMNLCVGCGARRVRPRREDRTVRIDRRARRGRDHDRLRAPRRRRPAMRAQ